MAQQTAVEWLQQSMEIHLSHEQKMQYEGLFQQAKEMHKAECISFVEKWQGIKRWDNKEDLYNHIYKK